MTKLLLLWVGALIAFIALLWVLAGNNLAMMKVFAPAAEAVRRETFEESKAYSDGMEKDLLAMQMEYVRANPEHRAALAALIKQRAAGYTPKSFALKTFLNGL
jgi:hypothetical protein